MKSKRKNKILSERAIDEFVVAQADDDSVWEKPLHVRRARPAYFRFSAELTAGAAFFAQLHRDAHMNNWLQRFF